MPSRFAQYGGAAGADQVLQQMIAEKLKAEEVQRGIQQQQVENDQRNRALTQGDTRLGQEQQQIDMARQPKTPGLMTMAPGASVGDPTTGRIIMTAPKDQADKFGDWQKQYDYELAHPKPSTAAPKEEKLIAIDTTDAQGQTVTKYLPESQVRGQTFPKPAPGGAGGGTAGLQGARAESAINMLDNLQNVHSRLNVGSGPGQLVSGAMDRIKGALNMQNAATEYQKLRKATAVALAVAIQGSRPSDADAEAMSSLLPDFNTPKEVSANLFASAKRQLQATSANMRNQKPAPGAADTAPVPMMAPDGRPLMVPADRVMEMEAKGAKRR